MASSLLKIVYPLEWDQEVGFVLHVTNEPPNLVGGKTSRGTKPLAVKGEPTKLYMQLNSYNYTDN